MGPSLGNTGISLPSLPCGRQQLWGACQKKVQKWSLGLECPAQISLQSPTDHELNLTRQGLAPLLVTFTGVIIRKIQKVPIHGPVCCPDLDSRHYLSHPHTHHRHPFMPRLPPLLCLLISFTFLPHAPHSSPEYLIPIIVYCRSTRRCDLTTGYIPHSVLYIYINLISDLKSEL